jgi:hypothetical protein
MENPEENCYFYGEKNIFLKDPPNGELPIWKITPWANPEKIASPIPMAYHQFP